MGYTMRQYKEGCRGGVVWSTKWGVEGKYTE